MATKVYGIHGYTTAPIRIPTRNGQAWIQCEFTKGRPTGGSNYKPATFITADRTVQNIIEQSAYFGRLIKLLEVYGKDEAPAPVKKEQTKEPEAKQAEANVYPDVETFEQAVAILKSIGAKATQLKSVDAIKKYMALNKVTFPNYEFD